MLSYFSFGAISIGTTALTAEPPFPRLLKYFLVEGKYYCDKVCEKNFEVKLFAATGFENKGLK